MQYLASLGLGAMRVPQRSGVWLPADGQRPERKICALGVRVTRGVTMHGIGLNVNPNLELLAWSGSFPAALVTPELPHWPLSCLEIGPLARLPTNYAPTWKST